MFSMDGVCRYRGVFFCQIFLLFRLEPALDLFSAVKRTLLERIRIFYGSLYCFFYFLCGEVSKWILKDPKR